MVDLKKEFCYVEKGRLVWHKIKKRYSFTHMFGLVIFPMADSTINDEAVALLYDYKEKMFLNKIVVVTNQENVAYALKTVGYKDICCESVSNKEMEYLLKYYRLVNFWEYIVVVSLEEPFGNSTFLRNKKVNLSNYILSAIYKVAGGKE